MDTREAAREAARRAGMSLGEWLDTIIAEEAEALGVSPDEVDADDQLEAVTARLSQMSGGHRAAPRRTRPERAGGMRKAAPDEDYDPAPRRVRSPRREQDESEALLDAAIAAMERRNTKSERKTLSALDIVASRLADIEERITERGEAAHYRPIKSALGRLEERLAAMAAPRPVSKQDEQAETALHNLAGRLESVIDRLGQTPQTVPPATAEHLARLEARISGLTAGAPAAPMPFNRPARPLARRAGSENIADILQRQRMLDAPARPAQLVSEPVWPPSAMADLDRRLEQMASRIEKAADTAASTQNVGQKAYSDLHGEIAKLATRLETMGRDRAAPPDPQPEIALLRREIAGLSQGLSELAPRGSVAALETAVRDLATRVDASRQDGVRESVLAPVEHLMTDLRSALQNFDPHTNIEALDREIKDIGRKVETMTLSGFDPEAFGRIHAQTQEIRDLLASAAHRPLPVEKIERQIAALGSRVDELAAQGAPAAQEHVNEAVGEIRSMLDRSMAGQNLGGLEKRLEILAAKIDQSVAARPAVQAPAADLGAIERMMQDLGARIELNHAGGQDTRALEDLQTQMALIGERLNRSDTSLASLDSIERAIGELFDRLDKTQAGAIDAAAKAARIAAHDALSDVVAKLPAGNAGPETQHLKRDLADLRNMQDIADQRTHSTLSAVHETLEKVVDRLAMLEDDISHGRPAEIMRASEAPVSAPVFAPPHKSIERAPPLELKSAAAEKSSKAEAIRSVTDAVREARAHLNSAQPGNAGRGREIAGAHEPDDLLMEPGSGTPKSRAASADAAPAFSAARQAVTGAADEAANGGKSSRESFIAAARRAHLAVAAEQAGGLDDMRAKAAGLGAVASGVTSKARALFASRKRPLLIGLIGLPLALGAVMAVRALNGPAAPLQKSETPAQTSISAPASATANAASPSETAPVPETAPSRLPPGQAEGEPLRKPQAGNFPPPGSIGAGIDRQAVGTIAAKPPQGVAALDPGVNALGSSLRDAVLAGNAAAQYEFATRLAEGRGAPRDLKAASIWFEKAAGQGLAPAQYRLGSLYEKGLGVTRDAPLAKAWYQRAADKGNARAMHNLAVLTAEGAGGKPDYAAAAGWFKKAAEYGVRDSEYNLAILYARGLGIEQSLAQSFFWFSIAAGQGDEDAGKKRDEVAVKLDAKALVAAKAAIADFRIKSPEQSANEVAPPPGGWDAPPAKADPKAKPAAKVSGL